MDRRNNTVGIVLMCCGMMTTYALVVPNLGALYRFRYEFFMPLVALRIAGGIALLEQAKRDHP